MVDSLAAIRDNLVTAFKFRKIAAQHRALQNAADDRARAATDLGLMIASSMA
jgi:hypothetical protein